MKALAVVLSLSLACALTANAAPSKLLPGDACPDERPAIFLPNADALHIAGELAAQRARADALEAGLARQKRNAVIAIAGVALACAAAGVAAGVAGVELSRKH